jgi:hypothetical protein
MNDQLVVSFKMNEQIIIALSNNCQFIIAFNVNDQLIIALTNNFQHIIVFEMDYQLIIGSKGMIRSLMNVTRTIISLMHSKGRI